MFMFKAKQKKSQAVKFGIPEGLPDLSQHKDEAVRRAYAFVLTLGEPGAGLVFRLALKLEALSSGSHKLGTRPFLQGGLVPWLAYWANRIWQGEKALTHSDALMVSDYVLACYDIQRMKERLKGAK